jgi:outer membrane biosynthesis protein TonB
MKRQLVLLGMAVLGVSLSGCPFKKQPPPVPQQGQAPTIPAPEPAPQAPPEQPPEEAQPAPAPAETQPEKTEAAEKPQPKKKSPKKAAAPPQGQQPSQASTPTAPAKTSKLIIQEGGTSSSQGELAAGVGLEDPSAHKQSTEELLRSTQANLNTINRPLSPDEQAMVAQIKDYMAQSRKAAADSDTVRARNLALKAHLLSDELVKH